MYALIYDEFEPAKREKRVVSVHKTRLTAEKALTKKAAQARQKGLGLQYPDRLGLRPGSRRRYHFGQLF